MALSPSLRRKHAQVAAARRWSDPETADRLQSEFEREKLTETLQQLRDLRPGLFDAAVAEVAS